MKDKQNKLFRGLVFKKSKKGTNILTENIMFIILNLVFLTILVLFLFLKSGGAAVMEERYAKQIALMIDAARSGAEMTIEMDDGLRKKDESLLQENVVVIKDNVVTVKFRKKGGYAYSFFNDLKIQDYHWNGDKLFILVK